MRIFVCYRREDTAPWAGRLHDALAGRFGSSNIFQDVVAVRPGESFLEAMDTAVTEADLVLVMIGPRWLSSTTGGEPRLGRADDYVRRELEAAIGRQKRLVPVLVGGAAMPGPHQLPESLRQVATRQAVVLHDESWHSDIEALARTLDGRPPPAARRARRWQVAGAIALVLVAVATTWAVADRGGAGSATSRTDGPTGTPKPAATAVCDNPQAPEWTTLGLVSRPSDPKLGWLFALEGGGFREAGHGRWDVVIRLRAANRRDEAVTLSPVAYRLNVSGTLFEQTCFSYLGTEKPDAGDSTSAYVGFSVTEDPRQARTVDIVLYPDHYRVDLQPRDSG